jgi:hypothetical protein
MDWTIWKRSFFCLTCDSVLNYFTCRCLQFLIGAEADDRLKAHDEGGAHEDMDSWDNFSVGSTVSKALSAAAETSAAGHPQAHRAGHGHGKKHSKEAHLSLGPVVEESLLGVLCALGILHSPEYQVLTAHCNIFLR